MRAFILVMFLVGIWLSRALVVQAAAPGCAPSVQVTTSAVSWHNDAITALAVTVQATSSDPTNRLSRITFTSGTNGVVEVDGAVRPTPFVVDLNPPVPVWSFVLRQDRDGEAFLLPFIATDRCGNAEKFVGAGQGSSGTASRAPVRTATPSPASRRTPTATATQTMQATATVTTSPTSTLTSTPTLTPSPTLTPNPTLTSTPASSPSTTPTFTATPASAPPTPDELWREVRTAGMEGGNLSEFDAMSVENGGLAVTGASPGAAAGSQYLAAQTAGTGGGANGFARGQWTVAWGPGTVYRTELSVYLPAGFYASQQGAVQLIGWDTFPTLNNHMRLAIWQSDRQARLFLKTDGRDAALTGGFALPEGRWVRIAIEQKIADAGGWSRVYLDGQLVAQGNGDTATPYPVTRMRVGLVAIDAVAQTTPLTVFFDDVRLSLAQ